jgi:CDP-glucose 4,6-dehydratase
MDDLSFYHGRRVFITGHTGFKGAWLTLWLRQRGALVSGFSLDVPTSPSLFEILGLAGEIRHHCGDVRDAEHLTDVIQQEQPEVIFHLAAQALVRRGYRFPKETFDTNVGGTVNLLEAARHANSVRSVICVTSDKCYHSPGWNWGFRESDPLGGADPYSASKAAAEMAIAAYRESFFSPTSVSGRGIGLASVRAGNVLGGGDWAEDRIVPDCIRALASDEPIRLRRPEAIRPWQHVLEPLAGYLILAARLTQEPEQFGGGWNFGPAANQACTVAELVQELVQHWPNGKSIALQVAALATPRETECLRLCSDKAIANLPWRPQGSFQDAVRQTMEWYRAFYRGESQQELRDICRRQIGQYEAQAYRWNDPAPEEGSRHESAPMPVV